MIYLVSNQLSLFDSANYKRMTLKESIDMIDSFNVIQFDTETTGRDAHICDILCAQFGNKQKDIQIVVDTTSISILNYKYLLENKPIIGQNLKFDIQFLYKYRIIPTKVYDTMVVEQLLYLGYPPIGKPGGISFSLNSIAERYLNINIDKSIRGQIIWRGLDESVIIYAANDVKWLEDIMYAQLKECKNKECLVGAKLECDFVPVISYLEWCGIKLDINKWQNKMQKDSSNLKNKKIELDLFAINTNNNKFYTINNQGDLFTGFNSTPVCNINWSSSTQVIKFAKYLGFNTQVQDKKTGEDKDSVLEKHLKGQKGINDEFLKIYFKYQEAAKVCSTYGQQYLDAINPITGRIHTTFRQLGASSGRMACGSKQSNTDLAKLKKLAPSKCIYVQLQNLPADEETRSSFIPEQDNLMCSCDYNALESRLGADIYNEKEMLKEFLEGSGDMHSLCAKMVFTEELKDINVKDVKHLRPDLRHDVKPIEFSQQFGGSEFAIASALGCSIEKALKFKNAYDNGFKGISEFKAKGSKFVKENGYVLICKYTGHKVYWYDWIEWKKRQNSFNSDFWEEYKKIKAINPMHPKIQEVKMHFKASSKWDRMALNSPTQGGYCALYKILKFGEG